MYSDLEVWMLLMFFDDFSKWFIKNRDEDGKRYIAQQPLVYSESKYNNRRLSELWYHLMYSGRNIFHSWLTSFYSFLSDLLDLMIKFW